MHKGKITTAKATRFNKWLAALAAAVALSTSILLATGTMHAGPAPAAAVKIDNFAFGPGSLTIAAGTTVTWTNQDDIPHTIAGDDKTFHSGALDTGDQFSRTFTKPGTYNYFCTLHPRMTGTIVVQPASGGTGSTSDMRSMPGMSESAATATSSISKPGFVQLFFKSGRVTPMNIYWVSGGKLNYVSSNGAVITTALDQIDLQRTAEENAGRPVGLSPVPETLAP